MEEEREREGETRGEGEGERGGGRRRERERETEREGERGRERERERFYTSLVRHVQSIIIVTVVCLHHPRNFVVFQQVVVVWSPPVKRCVKINVFIEFLINGPVPVNLFKTYLNKEA